MPEAHMDARVGGHVEYVRAILRPWKAHNEPLKALFV